MKQFGGVRGRKYDLKGQVAKAEVGKGQQGNMGMVKHLT